jgi:hypothetical protein
MYFYENWYNVFYFELGYVASFSEKGDQLIIQPFISYYVNSASNSWHIQR